jgi:predicted O-methyltransferase YrrM
MSGLGFVKASLPIALKQPVKNFIDRRALKKQHRLPFDPRNLRCGADVDIKAIMSDGRISAAYASDLDRLRSLFSSEEISGGVNPGDRRAIYHLVTAWRPMRVLEIGTHIGASTASIALAQSHFGGVLTTVDIIDVNAPDGPWRRLGLPRSPKHTLASLGLAKSVEFVRGKALQVFRRRGGPQYDLVFLDGDHTTLAIYREIDAALCVLAPNGVILLHDFYPGCRPITPDGSVIKGPAIAASRIEEETSLVFLPLGELPWRTKDGSNATSLALVVKS